MKSFTEYLMESKKVYEFKVKLAGDYEKAGDAIKLALAPYKVETPAPTPVAQKATEAAVKSVAPAKAQAPKKQGGPKKQGAPKKQGGNKPKKPKAPKAPKA